MAKENNKDRILKLLKECKNHQTAESIAVQLNIYNSYQKINYQRIHLQHLLEQIKV